MYSSRKANRLLWDFNGDGITDFITKEPQIKAAMSKNLLDNMSFTKVTIEILTGSYTYNINLKGKINPYLSFNYSPGSGNAPLKVSFSTEAYKPGSYVTSYRLDFDGDGTFDNASMDGKAVFTYTKSGYYTPTVEVVFSDNTTYQVTGAY